MFKKIHSKKSLDFDKKVEQFALKERTWIYSFVRAIFFTYMILPYIHLFSNLIIEHQLYDIIICILIVTAYTLFLICFFKRFGKIIMDCQAKIAIKWYISRYAMKGKAITPEDFSIIRSENPKLYECIEKGYVTGYCYSVCFHILQALKKGKIIFVACRASEADKQEEEYLNNYTMHVVYANNGWCFDTFSQKQTSLDVFMKLMEIKECKTLCYEDIQSLNYEKFREMYSPQITEWAKQNDCYINF